MNDKQWQQEEVKKLIAKVMDVPEVRTMVQLYITDQYKRQGRGAL